MKIEYILTIYESRAGHALGFLFTRTADGASLEARTDGSTDNNIRFALRNTGAGGGGWLSEVHETRAEVVTEREMAKLPFAGQESEDIRAFVARHFAAIDAARDPKTIARAGIAAARKVGEKWGKGDLAGAVRDLMAWADEAEEVIQ